MERSGASWSFGGLLLYARKIAVLLLLLGWVAIYLTSRRTDLFSRAISAAKDQGLVRVHTAAVEVPFFSPGTLDPLWNTKNTDPIVIIPPFRLRDQDDALQTEGLFEGKLTLVTLFFSSCAGFCPTLIKSLQSVESNIRGSHPEMQYVGLSIDPQTDQPTVLRGYFARMKLSRSWKLLTGDPQQLTHIARGVLAAEVFPLPKSKGQFGHSEHFFLIDQHRRLRGVFSGTRLDVTKQIKENLAQLAKSPSASH